MSICCWSVRSTRRGSAFWYSNPSAHLVAAVLAAALERAAGDPPRTVLDYAREKLFDPLGISTREAFSGPLPDFFAPEFNKAGFGWGTDPDGIQIGGFGLRLRAPDLLKIGELYRQGGVWNGQQIVPADWIQQSIAPSIHNDEYGLLWWIIEEPEGAGYVASGYGGQRIAVLPQPRVVIVYLSATPPNGQVGRQRYSIPSTTCSSQLSCDDGAGSVRSPCAFRCPSSTSPRSPPGRPPRAALPPALPSPAARRSTATSGSGTPSTTT